jgi:hypothetical protein
MYANFQISLKKIAKKREINRENTLLNGFFHFFCR